MNDVFILFRKNNDVTCTGIKFTPRGFEVFKLVIQGISDKQIANILGMSYGIVRKHRYRMLSQNGCNTMNELITKFYHNQVKMLYIMLLVDVLQKRCQSLSNKKTSGYTGTLFISRADEFC